MDMVSMALVMMAEYAGWKRLTSQPLESTFSAETIARVPDLLDTRTCEVNGSGIAPGSKHPGQAGGGTEAAAAGAATAAAMAGSDQAAPFATLRLVILLIS